MLSLLLTQEAKICCPNSSGEGDAHVSPCVAPCAVALHPQHGLAALSSSEQPRAAPKSSPGGTFRSCPSSTSGGTSTPQQRRTRLALMFSSASAFSMASGCWLGACALLVRAKFGIPQDWKTFSWHDFRHPFDVTGFQCGLAHN